MRRDEPQKQCESQDVLTFKPAPVKIVQNSCGIELLGDPNYYLVVKVLREGPMTVREIEKAYNKAAAKSDNYEPKSDKTIYRYLKNLEIGGLVVPAGKRVVFDKTATETLFSRTARIFLTQDEPSSWWKSDKGRQFAQQMARVLKPLHGNKEPSIKCLTNFFIQFEKAKEAEIARLVAEGDEESLEHLTSGEWKDAVKAIDSLKIISILLSRPDLVEDLRKCFE